MNLKVSKLTKVEKRFLAAVKDVPETPQGLFDLNNQQGWHRLREKIRSTAYHEAGHFAAKLFTRLELSLVVSISIIPEHGYIGRITYQRSSSEHGLALFPPDLQRCDGIMLLFQHLAGFGTEIILDQSDKWESISEYYESEYFLDDQNDDFHKAIRIAEIMAKPYMSVDRILKLADKWTLEMLRIPAVWNATETVAGKLIEQGKITNENGELSAIAHQYCSNAPDIFLLPKWRRRLFPKPRLKGKS